MHFLNKKYQKYDDSDDAFYVQIICISNSNSTYNLSDPTPLTFSSELCKHTPDKSVSTISILELKSLTIKSNRNAIKELQIVKCIHSRVEFRSKLKKKTLVWFVLQVKLQVCYSWHRWLWQTLKNATIPHTFHMPLHWLMETLVRQKYQKSNRLFYSFEF